MHKKIYILLSKSLYVALLFMATLFVHCDCGGQKNDGEPTSPHKGTKRQPGGDTTQQPETEQKKDNQEDPRQPDDDPPSPEKQDEKGEDPDEKDENTDPNSTSNITPITDEMIQYVETSNTVFNKDFLVDKLRALKDNSASAQDVNEQDTQINNWTAMHYAAQSGNIKIIQALLDRGGRVDMQDADNGLPLHQAIQFGYLDIVQLLLDKGKPERDLKVAYAHGNTPLKMAAGEGNIAMVKLLAESGAPINDGDDTYKITPVHSAARNGHFEVVCYLVEEKGANISPEDQNKLTPLYYAVREKQKEVVQYLVGKGAKVDLKQKDGQLNTLDFYLSGDHNKVIRKEIEDILAKQKP